VQESFTGDLVDWPALHTGRRRSTVAQFSGGAVRRGGPCGHRALAFCRQALGRTWFAGGRSCSTQGAEWNGRRERALFGRIQIEPCERAHESNRR